jgi:hypothetical protein
MRIAPFAITTTVVLLLGVARPDAGTAADLLIPFAAEVDIEPMGQHVASFLDTSKCERVAVFVSGSVAGGQPGHIRLSLRIGVPDADTIIRAGAVTVTTGSPVSDETGVSWVWQQTLELIAPRLQPVLSNSHPSGIAHVNKAWIYCKTQRLRR